MLVEQMARDLGAELRGRRLPGPGSPSARLYSRCSTCSHVKPMPPCAWIARSHARDGGVRRLGLRRGRRDRRLGLVVGDAPGRPPRERAGELELGVASSRAGATTAWYEPIRRPNCSRSATYATPSSSARAPTPTASSARIASERVRSDGQDVRRAERAAGLAAGDDAERPASRRSSRAPLARRRRAPRRCRRPTTATCVGGVEVGDERAESERPARVARGDRRLVVGGQERHERRRRPERRVEKRPAGLLVEHGLLEERQPGAAVLLGDRRARPAELRERRPRSARGSSRGTRAPARAARPAAR